MVVVPMASAVTSPVLSTVATAGVEDVHGVVTAGVADPVNCVVNPSDTARVPVIVGVRLTVTTAVTIHPLELV